ncbi:MAG: Ig domain-containing protein, partial [Terriglobia bacterium]
LADQTADIFGPDTIGNSTQMLEDDELLDFLVEIVAGTGQDQVRVISGNDATTLTVIPDWDTVPDATSVFRVLQASTASSFRGRISADGAFVLFNSFNAFESDDTNSVQDVFVKELATGMTTRVSIDAAGALADAASSASHLSGNGDTVLFQSTATNLVSNDSNAAADLFVHERLTPDTLRVSLADDGSEASTCGDINLVVQPCADVNATLSGGGRLVAFSGFATTLVSNDRNFQRDVFLRDRQAATTRRLSLGMGGINPDGESVDPAISLDGSVVVFSSFATNLIPNDTNNARDIFLAATGISDPPLIVVSRLPTGLEGVPYQASLRAVGGTPPLFWTLEKGSLPPGLFLHPGTGLLSGVPREPGQFQFTVLVMDGERPTRRGRKRLTLEVRR